MPPGKTRGKGAYFTLELMPELAPGERKELWFTLSASSLSPEEAERTCRRVQGRREELLREKREVYEALAETAALRFPKRPEIEETYRWTQYLNDWIVRDVEQVGQGRRGGLCGVSLVVRPRHRLSGPCAADAGGRGDGEEHPAADQGRLLPGKRQRPGGA